MKKKCASESFLDFKNRAMDSVSPTFCGAKWLNATIWLNNGSTASCHLPPAHKIDLEEIKNNPSALHNTTHKKVMREQMLRGQRPAECDYCWKIEDLSPKNISDRISKTAQFYEEDLQKIARLSSFENVNPRTLEISFERKCNFACSYCNASFSSRWGADIDQLGVYKNLCSDGGGAYRHNGSWADEQTADSNPYIAAFWKWWPELSKSLEELRITGGEPLLSSDTWKVIDRFSEPQLNKVRLAINSNFGVPTLLIRKLIDKSKGIENLDIYTSCEANGAIAEYIRDGLKWDLFQKNLELFLSQGHFQQMHMMMTINSLCLSGLIPFLDYLVGLKKRFGEKAPKWSVNILRFPSFMSPLVLPEDIRKAKAQEIQSWILSNRSSSLISELEFAQLERLILYLQEVTEPHYKASKLADLEKDFRAFFSQYDLRRKKSFAQTFPELMGWFQQIPVNEFEYETAFSDGDSTKGWHQEDKIKKLKELFFKDQGSLEGR